MKQLFAYIRVSDPKQGKGVSTDEQRALIQQYAVRTGGEIVQWFEETRTAAKTGRPEFDRMIKLLRRGKADGLVTHKVDRGTRNYRDWAILNDLVDNGIAVHFANDNIDMTSRGGRLSADVQVLIAVDYIRNLREEALKGIHGRLKQGILPNAAGIGYLDTGMGNPKAIDPVKGPLVRRLFEAYATGKYTLRDMATVAKAIGLRNKAGNPLRYQAIQKVLRNPFYVGTIRSKRFGLFPGRHEPLIRRWLFDRVQETLAGKVVRRTKHHSFPFRRFLRCKSCSRSLIGSERKGFVYYRCSTPTCPTTSVREDHVDQAIRQELRRVTLTSHEAALIESDLLARNIDETTLRKARETSLRETLASVNARLHRLTDLLLDNKVDAAVHDEKRSVLLTERIDLEQRLRDLETDDVDIRDRAKAVVGFAAHPERSYDAIDPPDRRRFLAIVVSDCQVTGKSLEFSLREPFATFANRRGEPTCGPCYDMPRTFSVEKVVCLVATWPESLAEILRLVDPDPELRTTP